MIATPAADSALRSAIELKCSICYPAMSVANSLGGSQSDDWTLARRYKLADLIAESDRRKLDMTDWKTAVQNERLCDSEPFIKATNILRRLHEYGAEMTDDGWRLDGVYLGDDVASALEGIGI